MELLKVVCSESAFQCFELQSDREVVWLQDVVESFERDLTDVGAIIVTEEETEALRPAIESKLEIPMFVIRTTPGSEISMELLEAGVHVADVNQFDRLLFSRQIEESIARYEEKI